MTNDEAKFLLRAYRANGADAQSPEFREALEQAARDPELRSWFERQQRFDSGVSSKLREIPVPADLKRSILAGARPPAKRRLAPIVFTLSALAAGVVLAFVFGRGFGSQKLDTVSLALSAAHDVRHGSHGGHGSLLTQIARRMASESPALSQGIPIAFEALKKDGCRTLLLNGRETLEICAERNGEEYHLYLVKSDQRVPLEVVTREALAVATWSDGVYAYALVGKSSKAVSDLL